MARSRPDHRDDIRAKLAEHGPLRFAQLQRYLQIADRRELDYDLRCLRQEGAVRSVPGLLWELCE